MKDDLQLPSIGSDLSQVDTALLLNQIKKIEAVKFAVMIEQCFSLHPAVMSLHIKLSRSHRNENLQLSLRPFQFSPSATVDEKQKAKEFYTIVQNKINLERTDLSEPFLKTLSGFHLSYDDFEILRNITVRSQIEVAFKTHFHEDNFWESLQVEQDRFVLDQSSSIPAKKGRSPRL